MSIRTQVRDSWTSQVVVRLVILSLLFGAVVGCAPAGTQPVDPTAPPPPVEATLPSGWETYTSQEQCGYIISHPSDMEGASHGTYSWILSRTATEPSGPFPNFVYISVIPDDFQSDESGVIYNYVPAETEALLNMQVGESSSLRDDPNIAPSFTYTRLPDTTLSSQTAQTYENTQPWEFPPGTKEIRYYLQANGCTYLIGGYFATVGSGEPGAINEELFDEIIAAFQVNP
jgi:hypothetical protein